MSSGINRRDFGLQSSAVMGGLLSGRLLADDKGMPASTGDSQPRLVLLGLNALARAHDFNYFADGHRGAALVAAHLLCQEESLDEQGRKRIAELFDLNWAPTPLCQPFPEEDPDPEGVEKIGRALMGGGETLRQVGHNAIFAMLAIKGFRLLPSAATPQRVDGVCKLIEAMTPWRDEAPDRDVEPPPFTDSQAASRYVLREASDAVDRWVGYGQGFSGHMLTFGQSLIELAAMGDVDWADSCRTAFCKYVTVTRRGPADDDKRYTDHAPSKLRPNQTGYWRQRGNKSLGIGHVFKYPYSYYSLLERAEDDALANEWDAKAYHVF
ncbi:MAG: hypothetical protein KDA75_13015 [Planctomycetaceae bacterium]|nr:hypothetical protein [Planctomycetaceae bacterium]